jgi:hypothetical protein
MKKSAANARSFYKNSLSLTGTELIEIARLIAQHSECEGLACFVNQTHSNGIVLSISAKEGNRKAFTIRQGNA